MYMYIYIYMYVHVCMCVYIYMTNTTRKNPILIYFGDLLGISVFFSWVCPLKFDAFKLQEVGVV